MAPDAALHLFTDPAIGKTSSYLQFGVGELILAANDPLPTDYPTDTGIQLPVIRVKTQLQPSNP